MELPARRQRGRFIDELKEDLQRVGVREEDASDMVRWKQMICFEQLKEGNPVQFTLTIQ